MMTLVGLPYDVDTAAKAIGRASRQTTATDIIFVSLGILIGGIIGVLSFNASSVPISLTTSGGALIMASSSDGGTANAPITDRCPNLSRVDIPRPRPQHVHSLRRPRMRPHFVQAFAQVGWMLLVWAP